MTDPIRLHAPDRTKLPGTPEQWLHQLGRSTLLRVAGRDRSRVRAVSTLIHGNEPSGLRAVHGWLRSGAMPTTDVVFWIASVRTALGPPLFDHRALPGREDLNRCFLDPHGGTPEHELARAALRELRAVCPEALIDVHNNTGHNPSYAVACNAGPFEYALASLFGRYFVHSRLELGSLVEATQTDFPSVTIECGRAGDPRADETARGGLDRFLSLPRLEPVELDRAGLELLLDPMRVCIRDDVRFAIADAPRDDVEFTVAADIDRHNFETLRPGVALGWLRNGGAWPLRVVDAQGRDCSREYFAHNGNRLEVRREFVPIMVTTQPRIAASDCLFYIVRPATKMGPTGGAGSAGPGVATSLGSRS